jgi:hypothetical protein
MLRLIYDAEVVNKVTDDIGVNGYGYPIINLFQSAAYLDGTPTGL